MLGPRCSLQTCSGCEELRLPLLRVRRLPCQRGFSRCGAQVQGRRGFRWLRRACWVAAQRMRPAGSSAQPRELCSPGAVAPGRVGSSQTRDLTHVSALAGRLIHGTTRGVPLSFTPESSHLPVCAGRLFHLSCLTHPPGPHCASWMFL